MISSLKITSLVLLFVITGVGSNSTDFSVLSSVVMNPTEVHKSTVITEKSANPFVPIRVKLPRVPNVRKPSVEKTEALVDRLENRNIKLAAYSSQRSVVQTTELNVCKASVESTLSALPADLTATLDQLTFYFDRVNPRGLSNNHIIELSCGNLSEDEVVSVFVHELGHIVDLGHLYGYGKKFSEFSDGSYRIPLDDSSLKFYHISWLDEKTSKFHAERQDFVSGYAMTDVFEDFAESFNFYVLHGKDFRAIKKESYSLAKKYAFLRDEVFHGVEFDSQRSTRNGKRVWDTTLLPFNKVEFFARKDTLKTIAAN